MATIDYKEKYEQALERARQFSEKPYLEDSAGIVEYIFPELKESEDAIRKELISFLKSPFVNENITDKKVAPWIAWLEKHKPVEHLELKAGHWYICHRAYCCRADHLTVKEGERFMCEKDGIVKGFVIKEPEKYFKEVCPPAPIEDEQKPAWSEEDENHVKSILSTIECCKDQFPNAQAVVEAYNADIEWLKSLRPQSHWKPSDEQMMAIDTAINVLGKGTLNGKQLIELQEQLKKLTK